MNAVSAHGVDECVTNVLHIITLAVLELMVQTDMGTICPNICNN